MVIASGIVTSRISFSFGSFEAWPFRRWVRRRNEAIERSRTSSALSAVTTVRRPRSFAGAGLWVVLGGHRAHGAAGATADLARALILIGGVGGNTGRPGGGAAVAGGVWGGARRVAGAGAVVAAPAAVVALGLGFTKSLLGFLLGLTLGFLFAAMAFFFGLAANFGGLAFGLLDAFAAGAALGLFLRQAALFDFARAGIGQRACTGRALILGQCTQHHARSGLRGAAGVAGRPSGAFWRSGGGAVLATGSGAWVSRRPVAADTALAALFDHDLLASAMAEALAHGARLDAWLQRQGFCRDTQSLVARRFGINHSAVLISFVRRRTRRWSSLFGWKAGLRDP